MTIGWVVLVAGAVVGLLVLAWWTSGRAAPLTRPIRAVDTAASHVDREAPHTSSTCQERGWELGIGF